MFIDEKQLYVEPRAKSEAKPHSLEALIIFLENKNPSEGYSFTDAWSCLVAQAFGIKGLYCDQIDSRTFPGAADIANDYPYTFGGALARAKALQATQGAQP